MPVPVGFSDCGSVALVRSPRGAASLVPLVVVVLVLTLVLVLVPEVFAVVGLSGWVLLADALLGTEPFFEISWSFATSAAFRNHSAMESWLPAFGDALVVVLEELLLLEEFGLVVLLLEELGLL